MKKRMNIFVLVATAAMALASCQKNELPAPEKQEVHFTINAGIPQTKTTITDNGDGTYTPSWDGTENLAVLFQLPDKNTEDSDAVKFTNKTGEGATATFSAMVSADKASTETLYAIYPYEAFGRGFDGGLARLDLNSDQKPTATSFDPSCDILVARPYDYAVNDGEVEVDPLYFTRVMSVLRVNLKSDFADINNEVVESIKFQTGGVNITGYAKISVENPEFTGEWTTKNDYVTATYDSDVVSINGDDNSVYFVVAPVTIPADKNLTFTIKTENYTITKTIEANNHPEMKFSAGNVSVINLNIEEEECTPNSTGTDAEKYYEKVTSAPADWSGTYLIVFESINACWDGSLKCGTSTGQLGHTAGSKDVSINDNKISYNDSYFVVNKSNDKYKITSAYGDVVGNQSNNNGLKTDYDSAISINDDCTVNIVASDGYTQVAYNSSAKYIRFYKTSTVSGQNYPKPCLYKLVGGGDSGDSPEPEQPTLSPRNLAFSSETAVAIIGEEFTLPTLTGVTAGVTYSSSNTNVATVDASGTITLVAAGATTITATAPATDQYESGTASYTLTVKPAQGGGDEPSSSVTVSKTIEAIADANGWTNSTQYSTITLDEVITATATVGTNTGKYYTSGEEWRIYQSENPNLTITASEGYTIKTVKITYNIKNNGVLTYNSSNVTSGTAVTVNATSISFGVGNTSTATNGQVKVTAIEVVYQSY